MLATAVTASAVHLLNEGGPTKSKTSAAQAACLIVVVSISWDTLDDAIVVANFVMQRVMSAAAGAVIRPHARRACPCLGPYVMPASYLIRKKLARIKFVLAGNNFGAIRLRRRVLSRSAWLDGSFWVTSC